MSGPSLAADLGSLPAEAHHPRMFKFPKRSFGEKWLLIEVFNLLFSLFTYMSSVCSITISLADMYYLLELPLTSPFF